MDKKQIIKDIESMIKKAAETDNPDKALKFSQGACNAANAANVLKAFKEEDK